jgi:hypothetical protein
MLTLPRSAATIAAASPRSTPVRRSAVSSVSPRFSTISTGSGSAGAGGTAGASLSTGGAGSRVGTARPITPRARRTEADRRQ